MNIIYNKSNGSKVDSAQIKLLSMASCVLCHTHFHFFILLLNQLCPLTQCSSYPACFPLPLPIELSLSFSDAHNDNNESYHHPTSTEPSPPPLSDSTHPSTSPTTPLPPSLTPSVLLMIENGIDQFV